MGDPEERKENTLTRQLNKSNKPMANIYSSISPPRLGTTPTHGPSAVSIGNNAGAGCCNRIVGGRRTQHYWFQSECQFFIQESSILVGGWMWAFVCNALEVPQRSAFGLWVGRSVVVRWHKNDEWLVILVRCWSVSKYACGDDDGELDLLTKGI